MLWEGGKVGIWEDSGQDGSQLILLTRLSSGALAAPGGSSAGKHHSTAGEALLMNYFEATIVKQLSN